MPSVEGGIAGEQERELVPLQHLCVSTLFFQKRDSGGVRKKKRQHPVLQVLASS